MSFVIRKEQCPRCARAGRDRKGDNLAVYDDESCHCFSCGHTRLSEAEKERRGITDEQEEEGVMTREKITGEENDRLKKMTGTDCRGWRGIRKETNSFFGVRYQYDEVSGEPVKQFVPTTINGELVGYRTRVFPKDFSAPIGQVGKECDLVGQFRFKAHTGTVVIVGGEVDLLSAYQMLRDYQIAKGATQYDATAVLCSTLGENGAHKQVASNYDLFASAHKIVLMMDNDKAGAEATEKLVKVLPKGKVYISNLRYKDPNEYLTKGKESEFINDFYRARKYSPAGLHQSDELYAAAIEYAKMERLSMPPFLKKLEDMLGGGIPRGYIVMIAAASSIGKTTLVNEAVIHWAMNTDESIGILSLEATSGEYASSLLSRYSQIKFASIKDSGERVKMLESEKVAAAAKELFTREDGSPRFVLCDDRGDTLKAVEEKIVEMVSSMGVTCLIIDVLSDLLAALTIPEQEAHLSFQKKLAKEHNLTIVNVTHLKKSSGGHTAGSRGGEVTEENFHGSSSLYKSAGINIGLSRDKMAETDVDRNTTKVTLLKNRACGTTGNAGEIYYDSGTHTLWDKDEWVQKNPGEF